VGGKYFDEITDLNPRSWLSKYRQTSILYLTKMALFYHGLGFLLAIIGIVIVKQIIPGYEVPIIPITIVEALSAGPLEEALFFGIPFYATGNHLVVLATGIFWAVVHISNTEMLQLNNLNYGNFLFAIPSLFFSLRTWVSGKGWFAIIAHSSWNGIFIGLLCATGEMQCRVFGNNEDFVIDLVIILFSGILLAITYRLYLRRRNKERPPRSV